MINNLLTEVFSVALEVSAGRVFADDDHSQAQLQDMEGKVIAIHISDIAVSVHLAIINQTLTVFKQYRAEADVEISASSLSLLKLFASDDVAPLIQSGEVEMRGDARLGRKLKYLFSVSSIDWEELIAKSLGDLTAHNVATLVGKMNRYMRRAQQSCNENIAEYLQEESNSLPSRAELENYLYDVDMLRQGVDRLNARVDRCQKNANTNNKIK